VKIYQVLSVVLVSVVITACGPAKIPLSAESAQSLRTVAISSDVEIPEQLFFHGKTQSITSNFGLIGSLIGDSAKETSQTALKEAMDKRNVSVPSIVRSAFRNEMAKHTPYKPLKNGAKSDANLVLTVDSYGFGATGLSSKFSPHLVVIAEMLDSEGDVIWRNKGAATSITKNNKAKYTYEQMLTSPDVLREMIQTAANLAASDAMADL